MIERRELKWNTKTMPLIKCLSCISVCLRMQSGQQVWTSTQTGFGIFMLSGKRSRETWGMPPLSWTESSKFPLSSTTLTMTSTLNLSSVLIMCYWCLLILFHIYIKICSCVSCWSVASCFASCSIRFKEHLNNNEPKEVLSAEEYEELRASCRQSQKAETAEQTQEEKQETPPGEEKPATPEGLDTVKINVCTTGV